MNKYDHNFFTGRMKFLQQRQSLAVSAAGRSISRNSVVVSTACARIRGPTRGCRARFRGRATRARARRRCTIVRRDTCHVANADNAYLTTLNSILSPFFAHSVRLCTYARRRLLCSELCGHNVRLPTGGSITCWHLMALFFIEPH